MKINELLNKYTFHDSLLENISYDKENSKLTLTIDFCFWMQNDYDESQPETGNMCDFFEFFLTGVPVLSRYRSELPVASGFNI